MPLIPAQPVVEKETLSLRLDRAVHERLKQYAAFIQSPKDYIIGQALRRLFEKDHEFADWLKTQDGTPASPAPVEHADAEQSEAPLPARPRTPTLRAAREASAISTPSRRDVGSVA